MLAFGWKANFIVHIIKYIVNFRNSVIYKHRVIPSLSDSFHFLPHYSIYKK